MVRNLHDDAIYSQSNVTINVPDVDAAVLFYTEVLGLRLRARYGPEFAVVEAPGLTIALHPRQKDAASGAPAISIGLGVESLEATMRMLQQRGVRFDGEILEDDPVRIAFFRDPSGVPLYLCEESAWR
jgi:catechol 2,3-dioxygenase-like lactoylglutathione lyase family enzyme